MNKVIIIGSPGSGKSTFARTLHALTGLPLYHLDLLYWNKNATNVPREIFLKRLSEILAANQWIIDGHYSSTLEWRLQCCDTIFFLDYLLDICLKGIEGRKGKPRPDMPCILPEDADPEFVSSIDSFAAVDRPVIMTLLCKYACKDVHIFKNRDDAARFIKSAVSSYGYDCID